ncbi:MAG TPA: hypothetical protein PK716_06895 [Fervidobacterium sp.]|nr:hypothetical protein [Fervidobacterium sp.]
MSTVWKLVLLAVLIIVVVVISVNSKRETYYSFATDPTNGENSTESSVPSYDNSSGGYVDIVENAVPITLPQPADNLINVSVTHIDDKSSNQLSAATATVSTGSTITDADNSLRQSAEETQVLVIDSGTETTNTTSESNAMNLLISSDDVYQEMTLLEKSIRRYLSAGHKISILNSETLYKEGFINSYFVDRYDVSFRVNGDGYDIVISPRYSIETSLLESLAQKNNIKKTNTGVEYIFWIKAYKS